MSGPFIFTGDKYVPLAEIQSATRNDDGSHALAGKSGPLDVENHEFDALLLQIVQPQGDWECITAFADEDGDLDASVEPVLAFGLNVFGYLVPVTPGSPSGVAGDYVLRRAGTTAVYGAAGAWFGGIEDWLESLAEG